MRFFLPSIFVMLALPAFAAAAAPEPITEYWSYLGISAEHKIEIDMASLIVRNETTDKEISARIKLTPEKPFFLKDKAKLGSYYIDTITVNCKEDLMVVDEINLFSYDGTLLEVIKNFGSVPNPQSKTHFVTIFLDAMCQSPEKNNINSPKRRHGLML